LQSRVTQQFTGIQILRFVAAMLVVAMHTTQAISIYMTSAGPHVYWSTGSAGVDIFFVISGFVMSLSVGKSPDALAGRLTQSWIFLKRRLLRIVPLYWFYTFAKTALLLAVPALAARSSIDSTHVAYSLFFIPSMSPWGLIEPTLPVGWTLNFEMLFYSIFALAIFLGLPRIRFCLFVFLLLFLGARLLPASTPVAFYTQSIIFEFVFGMCVAYAFFRIQSRPLWNGLILAAAGLIWMFGPTWDESTDRLVRWGFPAVMLALGFVWMEPWIAKVRGVQRISFLGDASYSIYLSHTFAVPAGMLLLQKTGLENGVIAFLLVMALAVAVGSVSYVGIERPMTNFFKRIFFDKNKAAYTKPETSHAK
jgi:exopolysaccharide production protein ExoZ